jgi:hypothetical protein
MAGLLIADDLVAKQGGHHALSERAAIQSRGTCEMTTIGVFSGAVDVDAVVVAEVAVV